MIIILNKLLLISLIILTLLILGVSLGNRIRKFEFGMKVIWLMLRINKNKVLCAILSLRNCKILMG